jgi:hypothetical protein
MNQGNAAILAALITALIGGAFLLIARRLKPPVTIQDVWKENRALRTDLMRAETRLDELAHKVERLLRASETQLTVNRIMGEGFDALSGYVERTSGGIKPAYTAEEHDAIERAKALRNDDAIWNTASRQPQTKENQS